MAKVIIKISALSLIAIAITTAYWWFATEHSTESLKSSIIFGGAALICCGLFFIGGAKPNVAERHNGLKSLSKVSEEQRFRQDQLDISQRISDAVLFLIAGIIPLIIGFLI